MLGLWFGPRVEDGGLPPFDLRPGGYAMPERQAFQTALIPAGRAACLGPVRINDAVFAVPMGLTLVLPLWRRGWIRVLCRRRFMPGWIWRKTPPLRGCCARAAPRRTRSGSPAG